MPIMVSGSRAMTDPARMRRAPGVVAMEFMHATVGGNRLGSKIQFDVD